MKGHAIFPVLIVATFAYGLHTAPHAATLGVHVGSVHSAPGFNNHNPGLYLRQGDYVAGFFHNSERRTSVYAARVWETRPVGPLRATAALTTGAITGYSTAAVLPLVSPSVAISPAPNRTVRLHYIPKVARGGAHAVHLSLEVSL